MPKKKWYRIQNLAEKAQVFLYGYIGGSKAYNEFGAEYAGTAAEFAAELAALGSVSTIELFIFSYGGDADEGMAMHDILKRHSARKIGTVDALCASAATLPLMACDEICIPRSAALVIHNATVMAYGEAKDLRSAADDLEAITANIAQIYAARSGMPLNKVQGIMNEGRRLNGEDAVKLKLADTLLDPDPDMDDPEDEPITNLVKARALFDKRLPVVLNRYEPNTMTEEELKKREAALLEKEKEAERISNDAKTEAEKIKKAATDEAEKIRNEAKGKTPEAGGDLDTKISNAVAPLKDEIKDLKSKIEQGVVTTNLAGGSAVANVAQTEATPKEMKREAWNKLDSKARNAFHKSGGKIID